ncbi:hypothetical protein FRC11_007398 [Ceratobasidium sp. 423]|nr:hypothetical protein FRC11_007398 [Ceratobasidium sp. 423]
MTTNVQTTPNAPKGSRRRSFLGAAGFVAKSLAKVVDLPGLRESTRVARDVATALNAPTNNDVKAQELMNRIDDILGQIKASVGVEHADTKSEEFKRRYPGLRVVVGKLEGIKEELAKVRDKSYTAKLIRQEDIEQLLGNKEQELHAAIQNFCVRWRHP